ncbi:MFS transporter OS=Streptomyces fumanus OX=67302 GN=GCM10018772_56720 PE=4 SV=1 [Streptomyces fumanus]
MFSGLFLGLAPSFDSQVFGIHSGRGERRDRRAAAPVRGRRRHRLRPGDGRGGDPRGRAAAPDRRRPRGRRRRGVQPAARRRRRPHGRFRTRGRVGSSLRILGPTADNAHRGGLFAAVYLIAYTAYGAPVLLAGLATDFVPLPTTVVAYGAVVALLAATAVLSLARRARRPGRPYLVQGG